MGEQTEIHEKILNASSTSELMGVYNQWSEAYDEDLTERWGYTSPQLAVHLLTTSMQTKSIAVLDAGCGTGLVGSHLKRHGINDITGIDYSPGMLEQAKAKGIYRSLLMMDLNKPLDLPANSFDAVTCVGTFTSAHVKPEAVNELVRLTRPSGRVIFTVRDDYWEASNFVDQVIALHVQKQALIEQIRLEPYIRSEGSECRFVVLRVV